MSSPFWPSCKVDMLCGEADFDNIIIRTDSMTDPRNDRVLPIMQEEQIFMCREMLSVLRKLPANALILDVGTGSGIFAIYAAKQGFRVIAIDIASRAISMAIENAITNNIVIADSPGNLKPGSICFIQISVEDFADIQSNQQAFDLVILAPPYNPTAPGISPALHAYAAEDGQRAFREQIQIAPHLLKPGGYCIGNQMSISDAIGKVIAIDEIIESFNNHCEIEYSRILQKFPNHSWKENDLGDISIRDFLEGMYQNYLTGNLPAKNNINSLNIKKYIDKMSINDNYFALIYYQIRKVDSKMPSDTKCYTSLLSPPISWEHRIWLHQCIVDFFE